MRNKPRAAELGGRCLSSSRTFMTIAICKMSYPCSQSSAMGRSYSEAATREFNCVKDGYFGLFTFSGLWSTIYGALKPTLTSQIGRGIVFNDGAVFMDSLLSGAGR